jgi:hypothetical protein
MRTKTHTRLCTQLRGRTGRREVLPVVLLLAGRDPYDLHGVVNNIGRTLFASGSLGMHHSRMMKDQIVVVDVPYFDAVRSLDNHMIFGMDFGSVQTLIPWGDP